MKHLRLTLSVLLAASVSFAYGFKKGDLNEDGSVDGTDVAALTEIVLDGSGSSVTAMTYTVKGVKFTMIEIPGGSFTMGGTSEQIGDASANFEFPIHNVTIDSYWIGQTEVTQELWEAVMGSNPSWFVDAPQMPVTNVSWEDCQEFFTKLRTLTGMAFRLPTEAEWEYAARGGKSGGTKYAGSNDADAVAWYDDNSSNRQHSVATKRPNDFGLYDMSGNVWEWCYDWLGSYGTSAQTNPTGSASGTSRVFRGGSTTGRAKDCRVSRRSYNSPTYKNFNIGLRLAR